MFSLLLKRGYAVMEDRTGVLSPDEAGDLVVRLTPLGFLARERLRKGRRRLRDVK